MMRRTITTLAFLAVGGVAFIAHAADHSRSTSNWQYYAAGENSYRISDEEEADEPSEVASASSATKAAAATSAAKPAAKQQSAERNALYIPELSGTVGTGIAPTNYLGGGVGGCGCGPSACGCGQNPCGCGNGCGGGCLSDCYCDCSTNWFRFEYLMWFSRGRNTPALVTTSPAGTAQADAGVLGLPDTTVLYGDDPIGTDIRNGGRLTFSHLFRDGITYADVRFWGVEDSSETFTAGGPIVARPFFNVGLGIEDAFLVAFPGVTSPGSVRVTAKNDLIGGDAYIRRNLWEDGCGALDVLGGYQFTRLDDSLTVSSTSISIDPLAALPVGTELSLFDSFRTQNEFHGASAGILARSYRGPVTIEGLAKIALGNMRQAVIIDGSTTTTPPGGGASTSTGGLLALPTNIGSDERNRVAFVPEININLLYDINENWRLIGGYSFLYWSNVVLAGNQIDRNLNLTQLPGPLVGAPLPEARFQRTDFWVQGMNFGAEYRW